MRYIKPVAIALVFFLCAVFLCAPTGLALQNFEPRPSDEIFYPSEWTVVDENLNNGPSSWTFSNEALIQHSNVFGGAEDGNNPEKPGTCAISGDSDWTDYTLTADLLSRDDDAVGILFRYQDMNNYYRFSMDRQRQYRQLVKKSGGVVTILAEDKFAYESNRWYSVKIELMGNLISIFVDGKKILQRYDESIDKGKIGLYSWANAGSEFKKIAVTPLVLNGPDPAPSQDQNAPKPYTIQLGVFSTKSAADRMISQLQSTDYNPYMVRTTDSNMQNIYIVRLDDFSSAQEASRNLELFRKRENIPAVVTSVNALSGFSDRELAMIEGYGEDGVKLVTVDAQKNIQAAGAVATESGIDHQYSVQVGAYSLKNNADNMFAKLRTKGYDPYFSLVTDSRQEEWFAIRLGIYDNPDEAKFAVSLFEKDEKLAAIVTNVNALNTVSENFLARLDGYGATSPDIKQEQAAKTEKPGFSVQVGAFLTKNNADDVVTQLRAKGYEPYIFQISDIKKPDWHIVRIGDFENLNMALDAVNQLAKSKNIPAVITYSNSIVPVSKINLAKLDASGTSGLEIAALNTDKKKTQDKPEDKKNEPDSEKPYSVQVGAFLDQKNAEMMIAKLQDTRHTPYIYQPPGDAEPQSWYTVRIGDFDNVEKASVAAALINQDEKMPTSITHVNSLSTVPMVVAELVDINGVDKEKLPPIRQPAGIGSGEASAGQGLDESILLKSATLRQLEEQIQAIQEEVLQMREEALVRKKLELTEKEKEEEEEEILSAVGRDYSMSKKGTIGLTYDLDYSYVSYDALINQSNVRQIVEHQGKHTMTNALSALYALGDNLSVSAGVPFVYKYDNMGTEDALKVNDLGDMSASIQWQPIKGGKKIPTLILSSSLSFPTGRSPYKINPDSDLATGSGIYSLSGSASLSKAMDPVVVFGSLSASHGLDEDGLEYHRFGGILKKVVPGNNIGGGVGMGYALSYRVSINMSFSYSYGFGYEQYWKGTPDDIVQKSEDSASATFTFGTGFRITPTRAVNFKISSGLTNDGHDFSTSLSIPFDF